MSALADRPSAMQGLPLGRHGRTPARGAEIALPPRCDKGFREMTRYNNPLPHNQAPSAQGRAQDSRPHAPHAPHAPQPPHYEQLGWPPQQSPQPRTGRPAAQPPAYADPAGYGQPPEGAGRHSNAPPHDPYAALRPDGYGYGQPSHPPSGAYGVEGYADPQQIPRGQGRAPQAPALPPEPPFNSASDPYGAFEPGFGEPSSHGANSYGGPQGNGNGYDPVFADPPLSRGAPPPAPSYQGGYETVPGMEAEADQWGAPSIGLDPRDYGHDEYAHPPSEAADWGAEAYRGADAEGGAFDPEAMGYQPAPPPAPHGMFDQSYAEDEADYEKAPRRGAWKKVVGLAACAVLAGGGLVIAYNGIMDPADGKNTPLVKSAEGPSKVKPSDPGGKQFAHTDSKIMGRLGESGETPESELSGVRKVPVVTVGRDGSIQPPRSVESGQTSAVVSVPGLTVIDGLDGPSPTRPTGSGDRASGMQQQAAASRNGGGPLTVAPPGRTPGAAMPTETGAVQAKAAAPATRAEAPRKAAEAPRKTAAVAAKPKTASAGYVAVLASVPASGSSRIDALKQFADMQQRYGTILNNKTPDVQEANLGERGTYHRLLVGPPGSRDSANSVCSQLKAEGYSSCWVTAY